MSPGRSDWSPISMRRNDDPQIVAIPASRLHSAAPKASGFVPAEVDRRRGVRLNGSRSGSASALLCHFPERGESGALRARIFQQGSFAGCHEWASSRTANC